jgi:hypothetical protein
MPSHRCPVVTLALVLLSLFCAPMLQAQDTPKVEVGIQVTALNLGDFKLAVPDLSESQRGVGGRVTINLTDHISIEGEINTFPNNFRITIPQLTNIVRRDLTRDRVDQFLFGVKLGGRSEHWGIFAKVRPGYVRSKLEDEISGNANPTLNTLFRTTSGFALDWGGVLEFYPSRHTMLRFDLGDTIIRYETKPPSGATNQATTKFTNHNLQVSAGFGLRF